MQFPKLHDKQKEIVSSNARFKLTRAGRKGGKSLVESEIISYKATISAKVLKDLGNCNKTEFKSGRKVIYIAPTKDQSKNIMFGILKDRLRSIIVRIKENPAEIVVKNQDDKETTIMIGGWENRENYRGLADVVHITFDEVDSLKNFWNEYREIFRPMFLDTGGTSDFIGTPKTTSPNLKRVAKELSNLGDKFEEFHFTSKDNPYLSRSEIDSLEEEYKNDRNAYIQEVLAEYVENQGALFSYSSLVDAFTNTIVKDNNKYLIVDIAGVTEGNDATKFSYWEGMEEVWRETYRGLNTETIIHKIREYAASNQIPYSHIAVDAIGIGEGVATSSLLNGIVGFKSSYGAIKTDHSIVLLPNVHYLKEAPLVTDYANLRSQCIFLLAEKVNTHKIASKVTGELKENIIEELSLYQEVSKGDSKRTATGKDDIKTLLGRSPDDSDTWIMRMYFEIREKMTPIESNEFKQASKIQTNRFEINKNRYRTNSTK